MTGDLPASEGVAGAAASAAILVTYTTTPTERKHNRLLKRFTELESFAPNLLKSGACFITLTSKKVVTIEEGRLAAGRATQWLREHGYPYYIATTAIQRERFKVRGEAVEHMHITVVGHKRVPAVGLRAAWGLGYTYHKQSSDVLHTLNYLSYMGHNYGRLSWSYATLKLIPGGAAPHTTCWRYFKADHVNGFPGGVINMGWGYREFDNRPGEVFVPALGKFVPKYATTSTWKWCKRIIEHVESTAAPAAILRSMAIEGDTSGAIDRDMFRFIHAQLMRKKAAMLRCRADILDELRDEREAITSADEC